jgi:hypothetical protein
VKVGDLVNVHWGNCNWEGEEDVDWGYVHGVVVEEIRYWNMDAEANRSPVCGDVNVLVQGEITSYNIGRLKMPGEKSESR